MLSCENFESSYLAWKNGALHDAAAEDMRRHQANCVWCGSLTEGTLSLHSRLAALPKVAPSQAFDAHLAQRIAAVQAAHTPARHYRTQLIPRWAALGAGLATGFAVMLALVLPLNDNPASLATAPGAPVLATTETAPAPDYDSLALVDSVRAPELRFNPDRHSMVVSESR